MLIPYNTQSVEAERNKYLLKFDNSFKGLLLNFNAFNEILQKGPIKQTNQKVKLDNVHMLPR